MIGIMQTNDDSSINLESIREEANDLNNIQLTEHFFDIYFKNNYFFEIENVLSNVVQHTGNKTITFEDLVNLYFGENSHWIVDIKILLTQGLARNGSSPLQHDEIFQFLQFLLLLHLYKVSASKLVERKSFYRQPLMSYHRFTEFVHALGVDPVPDDSEHWNEAFMPNAGFSKAVQSFSDLSTSISCTKYTSLCVDDYKLPHHSKSSEKQTGLASIYHQGSQSGPVIHLANSEATNLILSVCPQLIGQTSEDCVRSLFSVVPDFCSGTVFFDKGYTSKAIIEFFLSKEMNIVGTLASNRGLHYSFTKATNNSHQQKVSLDGPSEAFFSNYKFANSQHIMHEMAYRNGFENGGVLMITTDKTLGPQSWSYEKSSSKFSPPRFFKDYRDPTVSDTIFHLTFHPGGTEWFVLRKFRFTSLTSSALLHYFSFHNSGLDSLFNATELDIISEISEFLGTNFSKPESKVGKPEAIKICAKYSISNTGRIDDIRKVFRLGFGEFNEAEVYDLLLKSWFLSPSGTAYGKQEQYAIAQAFDSFLDVLVEKKYNGEIPVSLDIFSVGLVSKMNKVYHATSCSGIVAEAPDTLRLLDIQFAKDPISSERLEEEFGFYYEFDCKNTKESLEIFHQLIPSSESRTRLLHHCSTYGLTSIFYVECTSTKILRIVEIVFPDKICENYALFVDILYFHYLSWMYDPQFSIPPAIQWTVIDKSTFFQYFYLTKALVSKILEDKSPLPKLSSLKPSLISLWNHGKGRVDETTRNLSNIKESILSNFSPLFTLYHYLFLFAIHNIFHLYKAKLIYENRNLYENRSISSIRKSISNKITFEDFITEFIEFICNYFAVGSRNNLLHTPVANTNSKYISPLESKGLEEIEFLPEGAHHKEKVEFYSKPLLVNVRLNEKLDHSRVTMKKRARCVICTNPTKDYCKTCKAYICAGNNTCSDEFHKNAQLPASSRKKAQLSETSLKR